MPLPCGALLPADGERRQGGGQQGQSGQRIWRGIRAGEVTLGYSLRRHRCGRCLTGSGGGLVAVGPQVHLGRVVAQEEPGQGQGYDNIGNANANYQCY